MTVKITTRSDYERRVARVSAYIADRLDEAPELARLAEIAALSPFHFHRVFRAMTGETTAEALRRFRMQRAAGELLSGEGTIAAIARRAGYATVEAFTRAFSAAHGVPPATYRLNGGIVDEAERSDREPLIVSSVEVRRIAPIPVVALRYVGPYDEIGPACQRMTVWAAARGLTGPDLRALTIFHDDPDAAPAGGPRADVCLTAPDGLEPGEGMRRLEIPGGPHAVYRHRGPYAELRRAYRYLYGVWLPASGREPADRPCFEDCVVDPRGRPPKDWVTDIYLPLV